MSSHDKDKASKKHFLNDLCMEFKFKTKFDLIWISIANLHIVLLVVLTLSLFLSLQLHLCLFLSLFKLHQFFRSTFSINIVQTYCILQNSQLYTKMSDHPVQEDVQQSGLLSRQEFAQEHSTIPNISKQKKPVTPTGCLQTYSGFIIFFLLALVMFDIDLNIRQSNDIKHQTLKNSSIQNSNLKQPNPSPVELSSNLQINLQAPINTQNSQKLVKNQQSEQISVLIQQKVTNQNTKNNLKKSSLDELKTSLLEKEEEVTQIQKLIKKSQELQKIVSKQAVTAIAEDMKVTGVFLNLNGQANLNKTLTSFYLYNTYPLEDVIVIYNDKYSDQLSELLIRFPQVKWIIINSKISKLSAIDLVYKLVSTPYVFYSQDNCEYIRQGFVEDSLQNFKKNNNLIQFQIGKVTKDTKLADQYQFNLNPGLRRMKDYKQLHQGYSQFVGQKAESSKNMKKQKQANDQQTEGSYIKKLTQFYRSSKAIGGSSSIEYVKVTK